MASIILFLTNFVIRYFYIFMFLEPDKYIKALPGNNNSRADAFSLGKSIFYPDIWSSYYLFVGYIYKLLRLFHLYDLKIYFIVTINVLLSSIAVVFLYYIAKKLFGQYRSIIISIVFIFYYPSLYLNSMIISENLFIPAILGFIYLLFNKPEGLNWIWAGLLLGISLLTRPILFPFIPFLIIWLLLFNRKWLLVLLPAAVIIVTIGLINKSVNSEHVFSVGTNGGVNFAMTQCQFKKLQYNGPNKAKFYFTPPAFWNTDKKEKYTNVSFTNQGYYYKMGLECLFKHPSRLFTNLEYVKNIFWSKFYPDFTKTSLHKNQLVFWRWVGIVFYILLLLYALFEKRKHNYPAYLFFVMLFLSLIISVYFSNPGEERYLTGYFFVLTIFAVPTSLMIIKRVGLHHCIHWMKSKIN